MSKPAVRAPKPGTLDTLDPNSVVGRKLRSFYEAIETEPVPSELLDLLEKLDDAERKANSKR